MDGAPRRPLPEHDGFSLIGDADAEAVSDRRAGLLEHVAHGHDDALPNLVDVVLDPARLWKMLRKLAVRLAENPPVGRKKQCGGTRGSLVNRQKKARHPSRYGTDPRPQSKAPSGTRGVPTTPTILSSYRSTRAIHEKPCVFRRRHGSRELDSESAREPRNERRAEATEPLGANPGNQASKSIRRSVTKYEFCVASDLNYSLFWRAERFFWENLTKCAG